MRTRRFLTLFATAASTAAVALTSTPALAEDFSPSTRPHMYAEETRNQPIQVSINEISPRILTSENTVTFSGRIENKTGSDLSSFTVSLYAQTQTPYSMAEFSDYFAGERWNGILIAEEDLSMVVPASESRDFTVTVKREDLPFDGDYSWGPRGVTMIVNASQAEALDRSVLIWDSSVSVVPVQATLVVPWTAHSQPSSFDHLPIARAVSGTPGLSIALPPEYLHANGNEELSSFSSLFDWHPPKVSPLPGPVRQSLEDSRAEVITLLPFDADPALIAAVGNTPLTEAVSTALTEFPTFPWDTAQSDDAGLIGKSPAKGTQSDDNSQSDAKSVDTTQGGLHSDGHSPTPGSEAIAGESGLNLTTSLIWPGEKNFSRSVLNAFPQASVLAPPTALPSQDLVDFTPHPIVAVDRASGETSVTGKTDTTSTVLVQSEDLTTLLNWDAHSHADALDRDQLLAATGAVLTRERPGSQRAILAAFPRDIPMTEDRIKRAQVFLKQRWVEGTTLHDLSKLYVTDLDRTVLDTLPSREEWHDSVSPVVSALTATKPLMSSMQDPALVNKALYAQVLNVFEAGVSEAEQYVRASQLVNSTKLLNSSVYAEPSVTVNLINKTANFPVRVTNTLPWDVTVKVSLRPSDPRLRITSATEAVIPASSTTIVEIPVSAIGAGDIAVTYVVRALDGSLLDDSQTIDVRLRAGWEDALTLIFALFVAAAFVTGLTRTIRRRMRAHEVPGTGGPILHGMIPVSDYLDRKENK